MEKCREYSNWEVTSYTMVDDRRVHHSTLVRAMSAGQAAQADVPGGSAGVLSVRRARNQRQVLWRLHYGKPGHADVLTGDYFAQVWANTLQDAVQAFLKEYPDCTLFNVGCERW